LRNANFHSGADVALPEIRAKIQQAKRGGLDHVVLVGYGEPSLSPHTPAVLDFAHELGMATSMITNGATGLSRFRGFFAQGLDHLHISSHGLSGTLDAIVGSPGAFARQAELKTWLSSTGLPFRTNVTLQQRNYRELPDLAAYECSHGVYHFVFLGFLPHYEWSGHVHEIAVHPAELRQYIEDAADVLLAYGKLFTIRYHPMCHLAPRFWPYVVNARYVLFDPWEWNYSLQVTDPAAVWRDSVQIGEAVANKCEGCLLRRHCGGWNRIYAQAFGGEAALLRPVRDAGEIPAEYRSVIDVDGGLHDLNPANQLTGTIRRR
jgi:MoaA/NifB/PqqE/SkfB family radical SAM enzyme